MASQLIKKKMRLFGMPYQFTDSVDPRIKSVSATVGKKYMDNILLEAPIVSIIPGKPKYLPGKGTDGKISTTQALLQSASDGFSTLSDYINKSKNNSGNTRLYDFTRDYASYMSYVNILCRTGATFLGLTEKLDGKSLQSYDWKYYSNSNTSYSSMFTSLRHSGADITGAVKNAFSSGSGKVNTKIKSGDFQYDTSDSYDYGEDADETNDYSLTKYYVQFYVDPDVSCDESMSNATSESSMKSLLDTGSSTIKDLAFMLNSGGVDAAGFNDLTESTADALNKVTTSIAGGSTISGALSRIINLGGEVIKGNNVIMPDVYQNSTYTKSYSMTVHLKTPYGTKFGYYMDIFVPMMHLLALAIPKQETANTYSSPFLIKAYVDGLFTCNLGIVTGISIAKSVESKSVDGLPTEVDVTLNITDLYSDLMLSPSSDPMLFVNNSSLVEYLAVNCGLSLITPNLEKKIEMTVDTIRSSITDIPSNVSTTIKQKISKEIASFASLTW